MPAEWDWRFCPVGIGAELVQDVVGYDARLQLDFSGVVADLADPDDGEGWAVLGGEWDEADVAAVADGAAFGGVVDTLEVLRETARVFELGVGDAGLGGGVEIQK